MCFLCVSLTPFEPGIEMQFFPFQVITTLLFLFLLLKGIAPSKQPSNRLPRTPRNFYNEISPTYYHLITLFEDQCYRFDHAPLFKLRMELKYCKEDAHFFQKEMSEEDYRSYCELLDECIQVLSRLIKDLG